MDDRLPNRFLVGDKFTCHPVRLPAARSSLHRFLRPRSTHRPNLYCGGKGNGAQAISLPYEIGNDPAPLAWLDLVYLEPHELAAAEPTRDQRQDGKVVLAFERGGSWAFRSFIGLLSRGLNSSRVLQFHANRKAETRNAERNAVASALPTWMELGFAPFQQVHEVFPSASYPILEGDTSYPPVFASAILLHTQKTCSMPNRWLPQPSMLHPFPDARFAATHPR